MTMRDNDINLLCAIGLGKSEAKIYIDLLKNPNSSVIGISQRTGIHRPNVYDSLRRLKEKGLIKEIVSEKGKEYVAFEPERLKTYYEHMKNHLDALVKSLKKISSISERKEAVSISEGLVSLKKEMLDFIEGGKDPIYVLGTLNVLDKKFLEKFQKDRVKKKVQLKVIFSNKDEKLMKAMNSLPYTEARHLNYGNMAMSTIVSGDNVYHLSNANGNFKMIKIQSKDMAAQQKIHFEHAWNKAKEV